MINKLTKVTYDDFKLMETIDPEQFDQNNKDIVSKVDEVVEQINKYEKVTDSTSGADNVGMTPISVIGVQATVQSIVEAIVALIQTNETDIEDKLLTHKSSNDHDTRYYTETESDTQMSNIKGAGYTNETLKGLHDLITGLTSQLNALNDIYSTDAERIAAINDVINQFNVADANLNTLINNKANSSDVYTKAQIDGKAFGTANIADLAITTQKILDGAVTALKIADGSIGASKIDPALHLSVGNGALDSRLTNIEGKVNSGVPQSPALVLGANSVIVQTADTDVYPEIKLKGIAYVNPLGKDGDCEDVSKWNGISCTVSLDNTLKQFGANSIKASATTNAPLGLYSNKYTINATKYYMVSAYVKSPSVGVSMVARKGSNGATIKNNPNVVSANLTRRVLKLQPSDLTGETGIDIYFSANTNTIGQAVNIDGIMFNEISASDYTLSDDDVMKKYPYGESYINPKGFYIENRKHNLVRNGNGEEGIGWWTAGVGTPILTIENGKFKVVSNGAGQYVYQKVLVKRNTNYYVDGNYTGGANCNIRVYEDTLTTNILTNTDISRTFNSGDRDYVYVYMHNGSTANACYFDSIKLKEGTTDTEGYKSQELEYLWIENELDPENEWTIKGNKVTGKRSVRHTGPLYGKDYDFTLNDGSTIGYKGLIAQLTDSAIQSSEIVVKYDGSILSHSDTWSPTKEISNIVGKSIYIGVSNVCSGWGDAYTPTPEEIAAYMNGWKAIYNNGIRYCGWVSIVDDSFPSGAVSTLTTGSSPSGQIVLNVTAGEGLKFVNGDIIAVRKNDGSITEVYTVTSSTANAIAMTSNLTRTYDSTWKVCKLDNGTTNVALLNWCKANVAPGYKGYRLHYKLANPEPITDGSVTVKGTGISLSKGDNYLFADMGRVLGEVANPVTDATNYYINDIRFSTLRNKVQEAFTIFKNGIVTLPSGSASDGNAYGNYRVAIANAVFDPNAIYTVDYTILRTLAPLAIGSMTMAYTTGLINAVNTLGEKVDGKQNTDSALDTLVDLSMYEKTRIGTCQWYKTSTYLVLLFDIFTLPKKCVPIFTSIPMNFTCNGVDYKNSFTFVSLTKRGNDLSYSRYAMQYSLVDPTIITAISTYGITATCDLIIDCRGRV